MLDFLLLKNVYHFLRRKLLLKGSFKETNAKSMFLDSISVINIKKSIISYISLLLRFRIRNSVNEIARHSAELRWKWNSAKFRGRESYKTLCATHYQGPLFARFAPVWRQIWRRSLDRTCMRALGYAA
jgi:hypothetical protein